MSSGPAVAVLRVPQLGFFVTSVCTSPQLSLLQQVPGLLALQSFGKKLFGELGWVFFGKLIDINWFIAHLTYLSEEYRCSQIFFFLRHSRMSL